MLVKICGITRVEDGICALENGADFIGMIFYPKSPRYAPPDRAIQILDAIREKGHPDLKAIGVFVDEDLKTVREYAEKMNLFAVQLHGDETPEYCDNINRPIIKAIRVKSPESLDIIGRYEAWAYLCDAFQPGIPGGTGKSIDASLLTPYIQSHRIFLAGGLSPENISGMLKIVKPYAVDVSTGVEISPGIKDPEKIKAFIRTVKTFDQ
ncbi:phosphoribosylanthranilate isomerase [Candidatus Sumerlaeota bacterium]|nr:phosphoribosylanthranilate isomerase [Candidatus Sumerlaeota bacterium]